MTLWLHNLLKIEACMTGVEGLWTDFNYALKVTNLLPTLSDHFSVSSLSVILHFMGLHHFESKYRRC